jgi:hypothetical protein
LRNIPSIIETIPKPNVRNAFAMQTRTAWDRIDAPWTESKWKTAIVAAQNSLVPVLQVVCLRFERLPFVSLVPTWIKHLGF